jgi:hypothetical protein
MLHKLTTIPILTCQIDRKLILIDFNPLAILKKMVKMGYDKLN